MTSLTRWSLQPTCCLSCWLTHTTTPHSLVRTNDWPKGSPALVVEFPAGSLPVCVSPAPWKGGKKKPFLVSLRRMRPCRLMRHFVADSGLTRKKRRSRSRGCRAGYDTLSMCLLSGELSLPLRLIDDRGRVFELYVYLHIYLCFHANIHADLIRNLVSGLQFIFGSGFMRLHRSLADEPCLSNNSFR